MYKVLSSLLVVALFCFQWGCAGGGPQVGLKDKDLLNGSGNSPSPSLDASASGSPTSSPSLTPSPTPSAPPILQLINIDFGSAPGTTPISGRVAVNSSENDYWNVFTPNIPTVGSAQVLSDLKDASQTSLSTLKVSSSIINGTPNLLFRFGSMASTTFVPTHKMIRDHLYIREGFFDATPRRDAQIKIQIENLNTGTYDIIVYGRGFMRTRNMRVELSVGTESRGIKTTSIGDDWNSASWKEGSQYVTYENLGVTQGQIVQLILAPDLNSTDSYALISGLQIIKRSNLAPSPSPSSSTTPAPAAASR